MILGVMFRTRHLTWNCISSGWIGTGPGRNLSFLNLLINRFNSTISSQDLYPDQSKRSKHAQFFYWNDLLFGSTFNEIVRIDNANFDPTQYSIFRERNFIKSFDKGLFSLMPIVVRAFERLQRLVDTEMQSIGCQKIIMPAMVGKHLWVKSKRWDESGEEVFRISDRHKSEYCLAPTHEEVVTQIVASCKQLSSRQLPIYLYQVTPKYRDELRTKFGMLRTREFYMKDLYTFDVNEDQAKLTYEKICKAYEKLFALLQLPIIKTVGSVGIIGGKYSHEFLLETPLGEDEVYTCANCHESFNAELISDTEKSIRCLNCKSERLLPKRNALELGHSFLLGDRYSSKLGAFYLTAQTNQQKPLQMGCYGLGMSRILASSVEYLSNQLLENIEPPLSESDDLSLHITTNLTYIRWPKLLVPFKVCLILPKKDSKEDRNKGTEFSMQLAEVIRDRFGEDVLIDNRSNLTIGKRLLTAKAIGVPLIIVAGRNILNQIPQFEVFNMYSDELNGSASHETSTLMSQAEVLNYLEQHLHHFTYADA